MVDHLFFFKLFKTIQIFVKTVIVSELSDTAILISQWQTQCFDLTGMFRFRLGGVLSAILYIVMIMLKKTGG